MFLPYGSYFDPDRKKARIVEIQALQGEKGFWDDREQATKLSKEASRLENLISEWSYLTVQSQELLDVVNLALLEKDTSDEEGFNKQYELLLHRFEQFETTLMFTGEYDAGDAIISVHAGTGGVDAQDWAEILTRMYFRFCERKEWNVRLIDEQKGHEAGIKHMTFEITGEYAFGWMHAESGVHRLVRISPFDAEKMRHTSFALVEVLPVINEEYRSIDESDLQIDTYRSSGHGGQSVNTTDSAVRITHKPTGLVVTCQNERSQLQNKMTAMKLLQGKLHHLEELRFQKKIDSLKGDHLRAQWGNQARSYVLQPYTQVKDHRTGFTEPDVEKVLDGDLEDFMVAFIKHQKHAT